MEEIPTSEKGGQGEDSILLEEGNHRTKSDAKMAGLAVRQRWPVTVEMCELVATRLAGIVAKKSAMVPDRRGDVQERPDIADSLAIAASSVLEKMVKVNQGDEQHAAKEARLDAGKPTEITSSVELKVKFDE